MLNTPHISKNIKSAMATIGLTEIELVRITKLPQTTVNQILRGQTKDPRINTLLIIADALNLSIGQITGSIPITENILVEKQKIFPLIEWADILSYLNDDSYTGTYKKWISTDISSKKSKLRHFALKTIPSMEPRFRNGSVIIVEPLPTVYDSQIAIVSLENKEPTLRKIIKDGSDTYFSQIHLGQESKPKLKEDADVILGIIIESRMYET